ncbi:glycosyltransferase [Croceimicrobium hydrocarbonivorans]|uniref:Glycosyltransferase n=1 Tax=Croceimicrobium hydrocarbonivorans TaxID=2761580 RepID=A0A7H0VAQ6_9FLAO|nr:glycosyltransferase [Croceimicrobium hydrocarbonivorans]QNR22804.1 glycosyltransferase [Croceimicrobium hydrocarbonivorans]
MSPLVSVYITNYNYERFIRESIESVLAQSLQDFELIIIDDGSTDASRDIIEEYRERPEVTIIYQQNKGLNITNNVAMRVAKGKYLMRLDADDYLVPEALEKMVAPLEADPELGLVFPDYYYVDAEGHITGEERRHNFEKEVSLYDQPAHGACTIIRLSFLKKIGGYNESFTCQDGYDLWLKFIIHYSVKNVNEPLFYYRRHGSNLTTNEERILETRRAIKETFLDLSNIESSTLAVIPVRNSKIKGVSIPLYDLGTETLLSLKVKKLLEARSTQRVYLISEDAEILSYARSTFGDHQNVVVLERPSRLAGPNQTLGETVKLATHHAEAENLNYRFVMTAALDFPFVEAEIFDDAVNTVELFKSDSVLSVRPDNKAYYRHTGHGLQAILDQEKFTRIEREALYRAAGGVMVATRDSFAKNGKINAGRMSHVVVDENTAFGIFSDFDFQIFKSLMSVN